MAEKLTEAQRAALTLLLDGPDGGSKFGERMGWTSPKAGGAQGIGGAAGRFLSRLARETGYIEQIIDRHRYCGVYCLTAKGRAALEDGPSLAQPKSVTDGVASVSYAGRGSFAPAPEAEQEARELASRLHDIFGGETWTQSGIVNIIQTAFTAFARREAAARLTPAAGAEAEARALWLDLQTVAIPVGNGVQRIAAALTRFHAAGQAEEREACEKIAKGFELNHPATRLPGAHDAARSIMVMTGAAIAAAIRGRTG